jgi:methionyl-tRNA formyltransferase
MKILFFGSTADSVLVLDALYKAGYTLCAVVTQPKKPIGRQHVLTKTPTEDWANNHAISVVSFASKEKTVFYEDEDAVINTLSTFKADILISASYGQKIPTKTISDAPYGGLNVHPSLLPRWRGADPIPWQIMAADRHSGVTIVTLTENMDEGKIIAQKKIPLSGKEEREDLRRTLFTLGANLLVATLPKYLAGTIKGKQQDPTHATFARRLSREDGFFDWNVIQNAMAGKNPKQIERAVRAYSPWPGVWTMLPNKKRMKILAAHIHDDALILDKVQIEGKTPQQFLKIAQHILCNAFFELARSKKRRTTGKQSYTP